MKNIIDKIYRELNKKEIDWDGLAEYISVLGETINLYDDKTKESILSEAYMCHRKSGSVNKRLTDLFIKYGFDVSANDGKNGASCLRALCWSSYDKYVIHIAEKLLELGADSTLSCDEDDWDEAGKGVLNSISWKYGYWNTGEYDSANMFTAYYEMVERQQKGKEYKGIRAFRDSVGLVVNKVEKLEVLGDENRIRTWYLLHCGKQQLVINDYVELMVNPYAKEDVLQVEDVSDEFKQILGAKIKGVRYYNSSLAKLNFDNGYALQIGSDESSGISEYGAWVRVITSEIVKLPIEETAINSITLWGKCSHTGGSTFYEEDTVVLNTGEDSYVLYSHSIKYGKAVLRAERFSKELGENIHRSIAVHNAVLKHVEYCNEAIKWVCIQCDEGILYIVTNHFERAALFMSEIDMGADEVLSVGSFTKGLKKIKFIDR